MEGLRSTTALKKKHSRVASPKQKMTVSDRRRTCAAIWCTLFVGLLLVSSASAVEKNDNDDSNNLGLLTSACADNFCRNGVSGLDLWLSLEEVSERTKASDFLCFFCLRI